MKPNLVTALLLGVSLAASAQNLELRGSISPGPCAKAHRFNASDGRVFEIESRRATQDQAIKRTPVRITGYEAESLCGVEASIVIAQIAIDKSPLFKITVYQDVYSDSLLQRFFQLLKDNPNLELEIVLMGNSYEPIAALATDISKRLFNNDSPLTQRIRIRMDSLQSNRFVFIYKTDSVNFKTLEEAANALAVAAAR